MFSQRSLGQLAKIVHSAVQRYFARKTGKAMEGADGAPPTYKYVLTSVPPAIHIDSPSSYFEAAD